MRITLKDIAKELNISVNTVSKALNNKSKVSKELSKKIKETAERLGYEKNVLASSLSKNPIKIGVLIVGFDENYYQYTIKGLKQAENDLRDNKVSLDIKVVGIDNDTEKKSIEIINGFIKKGVSGIIFNDYNFEGLGKIIEFLNEKQIFTALLNYDIEGVKRSFSMTNDYNAATALACDILKLGMKENKSVIIYSQSVACGKKFRSTFIENAIRNKINDVTMVFSDTELIDVLKNKNVGGMYVSMASYLGVCSYIEKNYSEDDKPCLVVSDIYEKSAKYFENNVINATIYQEPEKQAYESAVTIKKNFLMTISSFYIFFIFFIFTP